MRELIYSDESTLPRKIKKKQKTVELQMTKNEKTNRRK